MAARPGSCGRPRGRPGGRRSWSQVAAGDEFRDAGDIRRTVTDARRGVAAFSLAVGHRQPVGDTGPRALAASGAGRRRRSARAGNRAAGAARPRDVGDRVRDLARVGRARPAAASGIIGAIAAHRASVRSRGQARRRARRETSTPQDPHASQAGNPLLKQERGPRPGLIRPDPAEKAASGRDFAPRKRAAERPLPAEPKPATAA